MPEDVFVLFKSRQEITIDDSDAADKMKKI